MTLPLLSAAEELLVVEGNDIRALAGVTEKWYGQISDVGEDPYTKKWPVKALGKGILARNKTWASRREWVNLPPEVIIDEVLGNVMDEELRAGLQVLYDMESLADAGLMENLATSGGGADGTITGTSSIVAKWGLGRDFTAETDKVVITGYNYDGFAAFGHGAHIRIANMFATRTAQTVYGAHIGAANAQGTIRLTGPAGGLPDTIEVLINTATQGFQTISRAFTFVLGQVYHIYATWDGSNVRVSVDGVQQGAAAAASGALVNGPASHFIGHVAESPTDTQTFHDFIDNVTSYDRAPSQAQVLALAGRSIYEGGLLADSFDPISFRAENDSRLRIVDGICKAIGAEWFTNRDGDDRDRFRVEARRGSPSSTDSFRLGQTVVPPITRDQDRETVRNDIIALGYGDAVNQLRSRIWHATTIRQPLAVKLLAADTVVDVGDASTYPADGVVSAGMERILYTGKTASTLTGLTRAYVADGYESLDAYDHSKGISVWLHADTTTTPDTYYDPSSPQAGSSIDPAQNGHRQDSLSDRGIIDQDTLDRLAQRLLDSYKDPRDSVWLNVREEAGIVAEVGDDVDLLDFDGSAIWGSPYRLHAYTFTRAGSRWEMDLGSPRDVAEAEMAQLREEMRLSRSYGQGSVTGYHTQMAENIEGGQRDMLMDLTISDLAVAVNHVTIENLRLRAFEKYTGVAAGSQAPTSSGGVAHSHPITGQATEDESVHTHGIPETDADFVQIQEVASDVTGGLTIEGTWAALDNVPLGADAQLTLAAKYVHCICLAQVRDTGLVADNALFRVRREPISWTSIRALWPMDMVNAGNVVVLDVGGANNHLTRVGTTVVDGVAAPDTGDARDFNGTSDHLHVASPTFINDNLGTVAIWVKADTLTAFRVLWSASVDGSLDDEFYLVFRGDLSNQLEVVHTLNGTVSMRLRTPTNTINDTDWHLVILDSTGSTLSLYVDDVGKSLSQITGTNSGQWFQDATDADVFTLGAIRRASAQSLWDGAQDEPYIFNRVLTAAERTKLFTSTNSRYFPNGDGIPNAPTAPAGWRVDSANPAQAEFGFLIKAPADTDGRYWLDCFYDAGGGFGAIGMNGSLTLVSFKDTFPAATSGAGSAHQHPVTGQATDTESVHTHDVTIAAHSHPSDLVEDAYVSPSVGIKIDGTDRTAALGGPWTNPDQQGIELREFISTPGVHTLEFFENAAGKVGRIHASVYVEIFLRGSR